MRIFCKLGSADTPPPVLLYSEKASEIALCNHISENCAPLQLTAWHKGFDPFVRTARDFVVSAKELQGVEIKRADFVKCEDFEETLQVELVVKDGSLLERILAHLAHEPGWALLEQEVGYALNFEHTTPFIVNEGVAYESMLYC